ncbi:MAG: DUF4349 domain-containing protein [Dehalococcoidia bacterium]|nr:MAG: DUF4349 domain-containing protein [Dehalococcoidia bacterium]
MISHLIGRIQTQVAWQVGLGAAVVLVAFGVATAVVMQNSSDDTSTVGIVPGRGSEGGFAAVAPEERTTATNSGAPAPSAGQPSGDIIAGNDSSAAPDVDRSVIRTGSVQMEVRSVADTFEQVRTIATGAGGFVADSTFVGGAGDHTARLTLRVPAARFGEVVTQLRGLAIEVPTIATNARDVTGETADIEATLRNLRAVEAQYAQLLGRANTIGDVLQVQERLNQMRLQIDRTEARRALIQSQTEMATLTVILQPAGTSVRGTGLRAAAVEAWQSSLNTLEQIATAVVIVAVYSWWIVPLGVLVVFLVKQRWTRRTATEQPPTPIG